MKDLKFYKTRFFLILGIWLVFSLTFVFLLRPFLTEKQLVATESALSARKTLSEQRAQQDNLKRAEKSLSQLDLGSIKPEYLLPREETLVGEISRIEGWAKELNLDLQVKLSGSLSLAKKSDLKTGVVLVPLTLEIRGSADGAFIFMQLLEKSTLPYKVENMTLSSEKYADQSVFLTLVGNVYVNKQ